jgi:hypothetical protein
LWIEIAAREGRRNRHPPISLAAWDETREMSGRDETVFSPGLGIRGSAGGMTEVIYLSLTLFTCRKPFNGK